MIGVNIYQIVDVENCSYAFREFNATKFNFDDYQCVASFQHEIDVKEENYNSVLDFVFSNTQKIHPSGMRSMSLSDVVEIEGNYYYCQGWGWKQISVSKEKMAIWKYDLFPYFLMGQVTSISDDGYRIKGYEGSVFPTDSIIKIMTYDERLINRVQTKVQQYREECDALEKKYLKEIENLLE